MIPSEYEKILVLLSSLSRVLDANQGQLNPADIRMRCLVNITAKEAKRALLEADRRATRPPADPAVLARHPQAAMELTR